MHPSPAARAMVLILALALTLPAIAAPKKGKKFDDKATQLLLEAAMNRDGDEIVAALEANADPNVKGEDDLSALMFAMTGPLFGRDEKVMDAFLKAKVDLEAKSSFGQTALMLTARDGRWTQLELLLKAGANVNARDSDGWTALMLAAFNGQHQCVKLLIEAKADVTMKTPDGWDAVQLAISEGRGSSARAIVAAGATVPKNGPSDLTPLVYSAYGGDLEAMRLVLEGAPDLAARDADGWSALEIAANNGYPQLVMELLRAGIDPTLKDKEGKTALDRAVAAGQPEIVALLGGTWEKPSPGGTKLTIPCKVAGGDIDGFIEIRESDLLFSTLFPKPMSWYLGGGNTNRAKSAKQLTYDGSVAPSYYLDTDANPKTGQKADMFSKAAGGAEYSLEYDEIGTGVTISFKNADGERIERNVFGNVFDPTLKKEGEYIDLSSFEYSPRAENNAGVLQTTVPMSLVGVKPGQKVRIVMETVSCGSKEVTLKLK